MARFEREAQVLASLNHPHIAQIYGVEESGGTRAIVMELVEGEDLAERIAKGPIPDRRGAAPRASDRRGARGGARDRRHPPRPEAGQHQAAPGRHHQSPRLRPRQGGQPRRIVRARPDAVADAHGARDGDRDDPRDGGLHGAGAGARQSGRPARRRLGLRVRALRDARGPAHLRVRRRDGYADGGAARPAGLERPAGGDARRGALAPRPLPGQRPETAPARHWGSARRAFERQRARERGRSGTGSRGGATARKIAHLGGRRTPHRRRRRPRGVCRLPPTTRRRGPGPQDLRRAAAGRQRHPLPGPLARRPQDRLHGALAAVGAGARRMGAARARGDRGRRQAVLVAGERLDRLLPQRAAAQDPGGWRAGRQHRDAPGGAGAALHQLRGLERRRHHLPQPGRGPQHLSRAGERRGAEGTSPAPAGNGVRYSRSRGVARRRAGHGGPSRGRRQRAGGPRGRQADDGARSEQRQPPAVLTLGTSRLRPCGAKRGALGGAVLDAGPGRHRRAVPHRTRDRADARARRHARLSRRRPDDGTPAGVVLDGRARRRHHRAATELDRRCRARTRRQAPGGVGRRWPVVGTTSRAARAAG